MAKPDNKNHSTPGKSEAARIVERQQKDNNGMLAQRMKKDWTEGSIFKNLLLISWPMTVTQTLMSLGPTIDMIWVGKLGEVAIAGVGVSGVVVQLAQGAMMGLTAGMRALIARSIGAKDNETAQRVAQHAVLISGGYAILMAVIGHFFAQGIISWITTDPDIVAIGTMYMRIEFIGGATVTFRMMMDAIMQASGDSVNPMQIAMIYRTFHIILCPFMIFGWWIFPELGVRGAAYTSIIAQSLGVILGLRVLFGAKSRLKLTFKGFKFDFNIIWRIIRVGFPALISGIQRTLNQFILQKFLAPFGAAVMAAHQITQRLEMFLFMPAMSFGMGAGVLVGQNLGANKPERAEKSAWLAVAVVEIFVIIAAGLLVIFSGPVIRLFNSDPSLDAITRQFIQIAFFGWIFIGFMFVLMNSLQGAGDTLPTMIIQISTTWLITIPFAYLLPKYTNFGAVGIRWAITASALVNAVANVIYFRTGKWKTRRV